MNFVFDEALQSADLKIATCSNLVHIKSRMLISSIKGNKSVFSYYEHSPGSPSLPSSQVLAWEMKALFCSRYGYVSDQFFRHIDLDNIGAVALCAESIFAARLSKLSQEIVPPLSDPGSLARFFLLAKLQPLSPAFFNEASLTTDVTSL